MIRAADLAVVEEPGDDYLGLLAAARQVAAQVVRTPAEGLTDAPRYIHRASSELLDVLPADDRDALTGDGAVIECLRMLAAAWPEVAAGATQGEHLLAGNPGLWKRAMTDWPMGGFARMAADVLIAKDLLGGRVVELGAGVGSASALVATHVTERFVRTDLQPFLLRRQKIAGTVERYDFNEPGPWQELDAIFAVNALHCARDKVATLRHLFRMLRAGGALVLAEGRPHTDARGTPWALNAFFGLFRGWWDVGGFLDRDAWAGALRQSGFSRIECVIRRAGAHDLGGVICAVR